MWRSRLRVSVESGVIASILLPYSITCATQPKWTAEIEKKLEHGRTGDRLACRGVDHVAVCFVFLQQARTGRNPSAVGGTASEPPAGRGLFKRQLQSMASAAAARKCRRLFQGALASLPPSRRYATSTSAVACSVW